MRLEDIILETYQEVTNLKRGWFNKKRTKIDFSYLKFDEAQIDPKIKEVIYETWRKIKDLRRGKFMVGFLWLKEKTILYKRKWKNRRNFLVFIFPYGFKYWLWTYHCKRNYKKNRR